MRIAVFTAVTGGYEKPQEPVCTEGADWFLFTDQLDVWHKQHMGQASSLWRAMLATDLFRLPQRNARHHKMVPHESLPLYDAWVWLDGSMKLLIPIRELLDRFPGDLVAFRHPDRDCLYDEAWTCQQVNLDHQDVIERQVSRYRDLGYPKHNGLAETKCVIRRNTPRMELFNRAWQYEVVNFSLRDQISFNYAAWSLKIEPQYMPPDLYRGEVFLPEIYSGPAFEYIKHTQKRY